MCFDWKDGHKCLITLLYYLMKLSNGLNIKPNGIYVDCTLGGAGHSEFILSKLSETGKIIRL